MIATPPVHVETARSGDVSATVSYVQLSPNNDARFYVRLAVARGGRNVYDRRVPGWTFGGAEGNQPLGVWASFDPAARTIVARDLDRDGEPEIVLQFWWGGAHCCYWTRIYRWTGATYVQTAHLWGDTGFRIGQLDRGPPAFVTGDDRFAYAFTSFAASGFPIRIYRYREGHLVDVTRSYPARVRRDAERQWHWYVAAYRSKRETRGLLAAWTADECLLGRCGAAFSWLARHPQVYTGSGLAYPGFGTKDLGAASYRRALRRFLTRLGY